jgi:hypothetical protein
LPGNRSCSFRGCWLSAAEIETRRGTRSLSCYRQVLCALTWFRDKGHPAAGRGFGLSQATSYRYIDEVVGVLAARALGLQEALERALEEGISCVESHGWDAVRSDQRSLLRR